MAENESTRTVMTLRVYKMNRDRQVTYDSGIRGFTYGPEDGTATSVTSLTGSGFPPCSCPRCRGRR